MEEERTASQGDQPAGEAEGARVSEAWLTRPLREKGKVRVSGRPLYLRAHRKRHSG
jgi:hypothetical protein